MRNIILLQDRIHTVISEHLATAPKGSRITSVASDKSSSEFFVLTNIGVLFCFYVTDFTVTFRCSWLLNSDEIDNEWFDVNYIAGIGSVVCISHSGNISCIEDNVVTGHHSEMVEQIGAIDGGISTVRWNPDQNSLVIVTNSDTLLLMSNTWDVLEEVPINPRVLTAPTSISWRGDGESFSFVSTDSEDNIARVRIYNRSLEMTAVGRNIADGDASVMKGIGAVTSFANNGSYVAVAQQRVKGKHQVCMSYCDVYQLIHHLTLSMSYFLGIGCTSGAQWPSSW